ncbi:ETS translocation variant 4-like [Rhopilema esculentum]|uniref:ETS translocation variant 4-like n=1 Tax=Rhopilema esculentum TaxID=499914 RepID=UPI0031DEDAD2
MKLFLELRRQILEDVLGTSYEAYVNFKREPTLPKKRQHRKRIPLWRFLLHLLNRDKVSYLVQWIDLDNFKFKIKEPNEVAKLWGSIKDKSDMTYEKLGRAMRYYYGKNIIEKVSGMRYSYRFILSKKTARYLERFDARRNSIDSTASTEISTESESLDYDDVDVNFDFLNSPAGSPSSFMNEDFARCLEPTSTKAREVSLVESIKDEFILKESGDDIVSTQSLEDGFWQFSHEAFMDLEDATLIKKGPIMNCGANNGDEVMLAMPTSIDVFCYGN